MKKAISRLQYITNESSQFSPVEQVRRLGNQIDWVQLRMKNVSKEDFLDEAILLRKYTAKNDIALIINDHIDVMIKVQAEGVHLGKDDMSVKDARKLAGDNFIIGGTANTTADVTHLIESGVDYIGLGPFAATATKKHLSPILGIDGIAAVLRTGPTVPVIAVGGIQRKDLDPLGDLGVYGVAVSSAICFSKDQSAMIALMKESLELFEMKAVKWKV